MPPATFDPLNLRCGVLADVAQPVEQRFRKLPVPIRPALTKNQAKRRIDGAAGSESVTPNSHSRLRVLGKARQWILLARRTAGPLGARVKPVRRRPTFGRVARKKESA